MIRRTFAGVVMAAAGMLFVAPSAHAQSSVPNPSRARRNAHGATGVDTARVITFNREVFRYDAAGRRDPFVSLITSSEIRPLITDLRLTTVAYDAAGSGSVAVLRDLGTKEQYRVKVGQVLGRMRVASINVKSVTFGIEEFGYKRQEILAMNDSTKVRTQ